MLGKCLELDPCNLIYRKTLRAMSPTAPRPLLIRWVGALSAVAIKSKMWFAFSSGRWRKVLNLGEEVLARQPADVTTHLKMATAAEKLAQPDLAQWFLEEGHSQVPGDADLMRALARFHESRHDWKHSIAFWEKVRKALPDDYEAGRKINDLSAEDLLANGHYAAE